MSLKTVLSAALFLLLAGCSEINLDIADGESRPLSHYSGQWLLINYWAIWCKPCIEEIPELNKLADQGGMAVLGYNFDRKQGDELAAQAEQLGITFDLLARDPAPLFDQPAPPALPATMVIDPEGRFRQWLMGPQTMESIKTRIAEYP